MSRKKLKQLQEETKTLFSTPIAIAKKCDCPLVVTLGTSFTTHDEEIADETWPIERFGIARIGRYVDPLLPDVTKRGAPPLIQILPGQIYGPGGLFKRLMYETITMNCRVSNAKAKKRLGWQLKYPTYREGLPATIINLEDSQSPLLDTPPDT